MGHEVLRDLSKIAAAWGKHGSFPSLKVVCIRGMVQGFCRDLSLTSSDLEMCMNPDFLFHMV